MIDLDFLYAILADVARNQNHLTYGDLSQQYFERTEEWHEPHGTWDEPLGELNRLLHNLRWPPLSAVVVFQDTPGVQLRRLSSESLGASTVQCLEETLNFFSTQYDRQFLLAFGKADCAVRRMRLDQCAYLGFE